MRMGKKKRVSLVGVALSLVVLVLLATAGTFFLRGDPSETPEATKSEISQTQMREEEHVLGDPTTPIRLIVYMNTECPYCHSFHKDTLPMILREYSRYVHVIYRHLPLDILPRSFVEAEAAECAYSQAGNAGFWSYVNELFKTADSSVTPDGNNGRLESTAVVSGLNVADFKACLDSGTTRGRVEHDVLSASVLGLSITPSFIVESGERSITIIGNRRTAIESSIEYLREVGGFSPE